MIDREGRDRLALGLRRLASGQITNDEFDDRFFEPYFSFAESGKCECGYALEGLKTEICPECGRGMRDPALGDIATFGWTLYSDTRRYRLRGRYKLPRAAREAVARCVLFLDSDLPYTHGAGVRERTVLGRGVQVSVMIGAALLLAGTGGFAVISTTFGWKPGLSCGLAALAGVWILWHPWRSPRAEPLASISEEIWPFQTRAELDAARERVRYLGGEVSGPGPSGARSAP
jgi:hypothetical protein